MRQVVRFSCVILLAIGLFCWVAMPGAILAEQGDWRKMLEQIMAEDALYETLTAGIYCPESAMEPAGTAYDTYDRRKLVFDDENHAVTNAAEEYNVVASAEDSVAVANMVIKNCVIEPSGLPFIFYLRSVYYDAEVNVWIVRYAVWLEGQKPTVNAVGGHTAFAIDAKTGAYLTRWGEE